ncbi:MAG: hypothetical protein U0031_12710 [Thermomicrobiales bacterium]
MWPHPMLVQVLHNDREQEVRDHLARQTHNALASESADRAAPANRAQRAISMIVRALGLTSIVFQPGLPGFRSPRRTSLASGAAGGAHDAGSLVPSRSLAALPPDANDVRLTQQKHPQGR